MYELLDRNHIETIQEAQTSIEALRRLGASTNTSLLQISHDVQQILQLDHRQDFAAETRPAQEFVLGEIASLRQDFISWTLEIERVNCIDQSLHFQN
jgi:hypothetical protein